MAAVMAKSFREEFLLSASLVVSLQTRKEINATVEERVIKYSGTILGRIYQLNKLILILLSIKDLKLIHVVGNGNLILNNVISIVSFLCRKKVLFSPLGKVYIPLLHKNVFFSFLHRDVMETTCKRYSSLTKRAVVIPPYSNFGKNTANENRNKLLFCSTPPHEKELEQRGIPFLIKAMQALEKESADVRLTILNRHPQVADSIKRLISEAGVRNVYLDNASIDDMQSYMSEYGIVVFPSEFDENVQVPMSVIEGAALGIPSLVSDKICLSKDITETGAGKTFNNVESFLVAVKEVREKYLTFSSNTEILISDKYNRSKSLSVIKKFYAEHT